VGFKITRALVRVECMIEVQRAAILHIASDGSVRSTYYFRHCNGIKAFSDDASAFALYVCFAAPPCVCWSCVVVSHVYGRLWEGADGV
jgi:hypothetical protein